MEYFFKRPLRYLQQDLPDELKWVEPFIKRIKPYIFVRESDRVLIRMPNESFKLNDTGMKVMHHLLKGGKLSTILQNGSKTQMRVKELSQFFTDLSLMLGAGFCDAYRSPTLERVPFELGYIELPVLSEISLTYRCNIKCRFCYASCSQTDSRETIDTTSELPTSAFKELLNIVKNEAEVPSVSFTGGEPTLRPDLTELISYAANLLHMRVNLITNGTRITVKKAKEFKKAGLASAQVSIEAPDANTHDYITQCRGSFDASIKGLINLKNAGILVHPHSTICSINADKIHQMADLAQKCGLDRFSANLIIPAGRGISDQLTIHYSETGPIVEKIIEHAGKKGIRFMWYSPTPVCIFNPVSHYLGNKGCSACEGLLSVDPQGNVLPCSSWREPVGNLLEDGFKSIWYNDRATFIRQKKSAHEQCRDCEDFALCHGACPLYFKSHGFGELEPYLTRKKQA